MELMHGTSSTNCNSIVCAGILPRNPNSKGNWKEEYQGQSIQNHVYFTNKSLYADFFGFRTSLIDNSDPVIVTVELNEDRLYPDENFFISGRACKDQYEEAQKRH